MVNLRKNLLYYSSFGCQNTNLFITASAILSAKKFKDDSFDILLYCDVNMFVCLNKFWPGITDGIRVWKSYYAYTSPFDATWSRYEIFNWIDIGEYSNILYLDTDTIVSGKLSNLFSLLDKKLLNLFSLFYKKLSPIFALQEDSPSDKPYHGQQIYKLYKKDYEKMKHFSTGVLLFKKCKSVENIFSISQSFSRKFIQQYRRNFDDRLAPFSTCDQPTINFLLNKKSLVDVKSLKEFVKNNPKNNQQFLISHFPGGVGNKNKASKVFNFLERDRKRFSDIIYQLRNSQVFEEVIGQST